ncbi:MAG: hypothetical protein HZC22_17275 [Rhodocyclales bacterium]|nr:hypothetical protein [Rhodocyclales bacterium]
MGKLILFLIVVVAIYWWLRKPPTRVRQGDSPAAQEPETMVSCAFCGLHVPLRESVTANGRHYCGAEHRDLDGGSRSG